MFSWGKCTELEKKADVFNRGELYGTYAAIMAYRVAPHQSLIQKLRSNYNREFILISRTSDTPFLFWFNFLTFNT